jgi:hypothetical protein
MPRDGSSGLYTLPPGTDAIPNRTILSSPYNLAVHDVETDLNTPRPIIAGGTGGSSAQGALLSLGAEATGQKVTDFNTASWLSGTWWADTAALNGPVPAHAYRGQAIVYGAINVPPGTLADQTNITIIAYDQTDAGATYTRTRNGGAWGPWLSALAAGSTVGQCYLSLSGANLLLSPKDGNNLSIQGVARAIPDAGVTLAATGTAATTFYYIYAYWDTGTTAIKLEFSTTGYATQAGTGVRIKSGDSTRTLVGIWSSAAANAWSTIPTEGASYFNPRLKTQTYPLQSQTSTASTSFVEIAVPLRLSFITFPEREVAFEFYGRCNCGSSSSGTFDLAVNGGVFMYLSLQGAPLYLMANSATWVWYFHRVSTVDTRFAVPNQRNYVSPYYFSGAGTLTNNCGQGVSIWG